MALRSYLQSVIDLLFPQRKTEKAVTFLSAETLATFPVPHEQLPHITSLFSYKDSRVKALIWEEKYSHFS